MGYGGGIGDGGRIRSTLVKPNALFGLIACVLLLAGCASHVAPVYNRGASSGVYTVQRGDTLYSISFRHGLDFRTVARWNQIGPPYRIYPGQRLRLTAPARSAVRTSAPKPAAPAAKPSRPAAKPVTSTPAIAISWRWPTEGRVTRRFAAQAQGKRGLEIAGRDGQAVVAAAAGRVVYAGNGLRGYGNLVIVKHDSHYLTAYGYNRELLVKEGDTVQAGQRIATMGSGNGRDFSLHFELRRDGVAIDPLPHLPRR